MRRPIAFACLLLAGLLLGAARSSAEPFAHGLLWEISRPGAASSHLFGTMHTADPRLLMLSPAVEKTFAQARCFVLEIYPDEAVTRRFAEASELPAGERLSALMTPARYAQLQHRLDQRGIAAGRAERLKPWAALLLVTDGLKVGGPDLGPESGHSLDIELYVRARAGRKTIEELDSVDEQIAVFDDIPVATQVALLDIALNRQAQLATDHEQRTAAYRRGDLRRLMHLAQRYPGAAPEARAHLALLEKKVIRDRSVVMAYRLQTFLRRGPTFAAVGALHLYGRHGILKLLRDDGWTVRRVE